MRKWYGSIQNRLEENKQFVDTIKVGDGVTEYYYSDREPWEVVAVKDQNHITIRQLTTKRIDNNGQSESQEYEYISDPNNYTVDLVKRNGGWYSATTCTINEYNEIQARRYNETVTDEDIRLIMWAAQFDENKLKKNGKQTRYHKYNISIGHASKYEDPSF